MTRAQLALSLLVATMLTGCSMFRARIHPAWQEREVAAFSEKALFEVCAQAISEEGYPLGVGADPGARVLESSWFTSLAPFRSDGYRERVRIEFESLGTGRFKVRARAIRESNESFRPLEAEHAKWEPTADHPPTATRVLERVKAKLRTME